jgi:hypothetical protein
MTLDLFVTNLSSIYVLGVTTQNGATQEGKKNHEQPDSRD